MKQESLTSKLISTLYSGACLGFVAMVPTTALAAKGHCDGNTHWQCTVYATSKENGAWYDNKTGQWYNKSCSCVANDGGSDDGFGGSYGHAEIHKKNVPTVKPSGVNPSNIDVHTMRIAPRIPTMEMRPATTLGR